MASHTPHLGSTNAWSARATAGIVLLCVLVVPALLRAATAITDSTTVTGSASILGALSKGSGTFVIDHPLDPENKLLYHSFVESPDVKNIYDGIAVLDERGEAMVELPEYFLALNSEYRYQASAQGEPMPNLHLKSPVRKQYLLFGAARFSIAGGTPGGTISWQVTGIRHDPYILANPIIPEVEKGPDELVDKGEYLFPELYAN